MPTPTQTNIPLDFRQKHYDGTSSDADDGVLVFDRFAKKIYVSGVEYYPAFTGATNQTDGTTGTVPAPLAGEQNHVLLGDGQWHSRKEVSPATPYRVPFGLQISKESQALLNANYKPTLLFYAAGKADQLSEAALFLDELGDVDTRQTALLSQLSNELVLLMTSVSYNDYLSSVSNVTEIVDEIVTLFNGTYKNRHIFRNGEYQGLSVFFQPTEYTVSIYHSGTSTKIPYTDFDFGYEPTSNEYIQYIGDVRKNMNGWTYPRAKYLPFINVDSELAEMRELLTTLGSFDETNYNTDGFAAVSDYLQNGYSQFSIKYTAYKQRLNAFNTYNNLLKAFAESFTGDSTTDSNTAVSSMLDTLTAMTTALNNDELNDTLAAYGDFIEDMRMELKRGTDIYKYMSNASPSHDYSNFGSKLRTYMSNRTQSKKNDLLSAISTLVAGIENPPQISSQSYIGYSSVYRIYTDAYCVAYNLDLRRDKIIPDYLDEFINLISQRTTMGIKTNDDLSNIRNTMEYLILHQDEWDTSVQNVIDALDTAVADFVYTIRIPNGTLFNGDIRVIDYCDRIVCSISYDDHMLNNKGECLECMTIRFDNVRHLWEYTTLTISPTFRSLVNDHESCIEYANNTIAWIDENLGTAVSDVMNIITCPCSDVAPRLSLYINNYLNTLYRVLKHRSGAVIYDFIDDAEDINVSELYGVLYDTITSILNYIPTIGQSYFYKPAVKNLANMLYERYNLSTDFLNVEIFKGVTDDETALDGTYTDSGLLIAPAGLVPSAEAVDNGKVLSANGKWIDVVNGWDIYDRLTQ